MMTFEPRIDEEEPRKQSDDQPTNYLDQLPHQVVVDILSRLPITSLLQFSFVSPSLNSLCHHPHLANAHSSRSSTNGSSVLILHSDYPIQNHLHFLHISHGKCRRIDTPFASQMPEFSILGSSNGLLCLINSFFPDSIYFYNPFTRNCLEIAKNHDFQGQTVVYGFGFSPAINDYKVIKIASNRDESEVRIYTLRCNVWDSRGKVPYAIEKWSSPGVVVSGRVHWVSRSTIINSRHERMIVSCDLADTTFHAMKQPSDGSFSGSSGRWVSCHLTALNGCLCAATPAKQGLGALDFWVMREYAVEESWMKAYSIRGYYPVSMISHQMERRSHIWRNMFGYKAVKVLCVLESGELLLEYRGGGLVSYDFRGQSFRKLEFPGMPRLYQTTLHVGTLNSAAL